MKENSRIPSFLPSLTFFLLVSCFCCLHLPGEPLREQVLFDFDWRFQRGDFESGESVSMDDSSWRVVSLPHDWSIEDLPKNPELYDQDQVTGESVTEERVVSGPFDSAAIGGGRTGYTLGGIAWYRKQFSVPEEWEEGRVCVNFEGVYSEAEVWINGHRLGRHVYGYTAFSFDLSPYLQFGDKTENTLAVRVKNLGKNSRWYTGSGIYRHVWLTVSPILHLAKDDVSIWTSEVSETFAKVHVTGNVKGWEGQSQEHGVEARIQVLDPGGAIVASSAMLPIASGTATTARFDGELELNEPLLWSLTEPHLYHAQVSLFNDEIELDQVAVPFGIRTIEFDASEGFKLNGKSVLIKGGCIHDDNGPLGAAAFDRAEERKVELLKAAGFNAIRNAHNPRSRNFLEACDRLGMLVIEEAFDAWDMAKVEDDYHVHFADHWKEDLRATVQNARNHPSVIMWSIGNQIRNACEPEGVTWAERLSDFVRALDPHPTGDRECVSLGAGLETL